MAAATTLLQTEAQHHASPQHYFLVKNKISDIIFLTSPYHTLRSKLIWKKNFPEVKVIIPKMTDTPKSKLIWGLSYEKIKIIIYEYLAIIYNKSKGWI